MLIAAIPVAPAVWSRPPGSAVAGAASRNAEGAIRPRYSPAKRSAEKIYEFPDSGPEISGKIYRIYYFFCYAIRSICN
jgi:hypothetical protein